MITGSWTFVAVQKEFSNWSVSEKSPKLLVLACQDLIGKRADVITHFVDSGFRNELVAFEKLSRKTNLIS